MKNKDTKPSQSVITREPFTGSKKIYVQGKLHNIKVAMREISLSDTVNKFKTEAPIEKNDTVDELISFF